MSTLKTPVTSNVRGPLPGSPETSVGAVGALPRYGSTSKLGWANELAQQTANHIAAMPKKRHVSLEMLIQVTNLSADYSDILQ